jgi:hypothetical protein
VPRNLRAKQTMKTPIAWPRKFLAPARSTAGLRPPLLIGRSDGGLCKGRPLDKQGAVRFRQQGYDVVVCGDDEEENLRVAFDLEEAAFPNQKHHWHRAHRRTAGPAALPHVQTEDRRGHTFYETARKKAK